MKAIKKNFYNGFLFPPLFRFVMKFHVSLFTRILSSFIFLFLSLLRPAVARDRSLYQNDLQKAIENAKSGNFQTANEYINRVLARAPHFATAHYLKGRILLSIPRDPSDKQEVLHKKKEIKEAVQHLRLAVQSDPLNARNHFYLGFAYLFANYRDLAYHSFKRASEIDRNMIEAIYNMAVIMEEKGEITAANTLYKSYLRKYRALHFTTDQFDDF